MLTIIQTTLSAIDWGFALEGFPIQRQQIITVKEETGIDPKIINFYLQWPINGQEQIALLSTLQAITSSNAIPCITWEPMQLSAEQILNGSYDPYILHFAKQIQEHGKTIMLRFAHEMNLDVYHWGSKKEEFGKDSPEKYKRLFRYVVDLFRKHNVQNVQWVFCPNCDSVPNESWNKIENYYPGDSYVDVFGIDGYNWGKPGRSFKEIFGGAMEVLKGLNGKLPIYVFETSTVDKGAERVKWIAEALKASKEWGIKGIVWFQVNKENDWRLKRGEVGSL